MQGGGSAYKFPGPGNSSTGKFIFPVRRGISRTAQWKQLFISRSAKSIFRSQWKRGHCVYSHSLSQSCATMSNLSPWAWAYGNEALSDVTIAFVPKGAAAAAKVSTRGRKRKAQEGVDDLQASNTIPGHRFLLATYSEYCNALFLRWAKGDEMVKLEYDDADDLAAAQACIKALYLQKLDVCDLLSEPRSAVPFLIKVIHWADMLQAPTCTELCIAGLADSFRPGSSEDINCMLMGLPDSVRFSPAFTKVQEVCQKWLQQTFSDVHEVITKDGLRKAFLQLCPQAVILWMKCDDLMGTENDVAFLVTRWHVGKQGKEATEKDLVALSRQLRVSQLSQSVRDCVLPELPWVREDYLLPVFATAFRRCGAAASKEITSLSISPSWSAPARVMKAREWFVWRVPVSAVTEMLEDVEEDCAEREHYSGEFYSDGATFRAYLELSSHRLNMKLYVYVLNESGHILDVSYCIKQSCPGRFGIDEDRVISEGLTLLDISSAIGGSVAGPTASLRTLLQEQLVDGHLVFKINVHPI